ncbi:Protein of unknown function [Gryllus bimaculatus]|nr:Protein of unknown function [Gryllus bimaculatus]
MTGHRSNSPWKVLAEDRKTEFALRRDLARKQPSDGSGDDGPKPTETPSSSKSVELGSPYLSGNSRKRRKGREDAEGDDREGEGREAEEKEEKSNKEKRKNRSSNYYNERNVSDRALEHLISREECRLRQETSNDLNREWQLVARPASSRSDLQRRATTASKRTSRHRSPSSMADS